MQATTITILLYMLLNVKIAARNTMPLPFVYPVIEQIKLTVYDSARVNKPKQ